MEIINVYFDCNYDLVIIFSRWIILLLVVVLLAYLIWVRTKLRFKLVKLNIKLGNVGEAEFRPNKYDLQIAHKIWTELVTRKAAIPFDKENDVIEEVYNSWYALFTRTREFISEIPADLIKNNKSTKEIVRIATQTLNSGLRPHLTKWQARYRSWFNISKDEHPNKTPQEIQKIYPSYDELVSDLIKVNDQLLQYSEELKKIIDNK